MGWGLKGSYFGVTYKVYLRPYTNHSQLIQHTVHGVQDFILPFLANSLFGRDHKVISVPVIVFSDIQWSAIPPYINPWTSKGQNMLAAMSSGANMRFFCWSANKIMWYGPMTSHAMANCHRHSIYLSL